MKKLKVLSLIFLITGILFLTACSGSEVDNETNYTVTFDSNGGTEVSEYSVKENRLLPTDVPVPKKEDSGDAIYEFDGWYTDDGTFEKKWDLDVDIVTSDVTLYAKYNVVLTKPSEIKIINDAFSNSVTWNQANVNDQTEFTVTLKEVEGSTSKEVEGSIKVDGTVVTWTPESVPQGGKYIVKIMTDGENPVESGEVYFKGEGTENNPYLITEAADIYSITTKDVSENKYFKVMEEFEVKTNYTDIEGHIFNGYINGNRKAIGVTGNSGLFYELGENAVVEKMLLKNGALGGISTTSNPQIGALASINRGIIRNSDSFVKVENEAGKVGDMSTATEGGAGGFVGTNETTGKIINVQFISTESSNGTIKASIAGGGIASINKGLIDNAFNEGTIGAGNTNESSRTLSRYSYAGGIAGINYGTITQTATTDNGKLLAQRYYGVAEVSSDNNKVFGGIVGYNADNGLVSESYFNGIRVHADQYVGGIVGLNAGTVKDSFVSGVYHEVTGIRSYVGGRLNVGGIVGAIEGNGTVTNTYFSGNIYAYEEEPYAIASEASNSVYTLTNHDVRNIGDVAYDNVITNDFTAPNGSSNVAVENSSLTNNTNNYLFPDAEEVLSTINGNSKFENLDGIVTLIPTMERGYSYTVSFDANGGEGTIKDIVCDNAKEYTLPANEFTAAGHTFVGWVDDNGIAYPEGHAFTDLGAKGQVIELEAMWLADDAVNLFDKGTFDTDMTGTNTTMRGEKDKKDYDIVSVGDWTVYGGGDDVTAKIINGEFVINSTLTPDDNKKNFYAFSEFETPKNELGTGYYVKLDVKADKGNYGSINTVIRSVSPGYSRPLKNVATYAETKDISTSFETVGGLSSIYTLENIDNGYTTNVLIPLGNGSFEGEIKITIDNVEIYQVGEAK